jgi:hypothetical protein
MTLKASFCSGFTSTALRVFRLMPMQTLSYLEIR